MRHQKDSRLKLWTIRTYQDTMGSVHVDYVELDERLAHYQPVSVTSRTGSAAIFEIADVSFTINKPSWYDDVLLTEIYTIWHGRVYQSVRVEDFEGKTRGDVRIYMQQRPNLRVEDFS